MYFLKFHIFNINYLLPKIQYSFIPTYITFYERTYANSNYSCKIYGGGDRHKSMRSIPQRLLTFSN